VSESVVEHAKVKRKGGVLQGSSDHRELKGQRKEGCNECNPATRGGKEKGKEGFSVTSRKERKRKLFHRLNAEKGGNQPTTRKDVFNLEFTTRL